MLKIDYWKQFFRAGETQDVRVGRKCEELTATQAIRFEELTAARHLGTPSITHGALAKPYCSFAEASNQLKVSEKALFQAAATRSIHLFINCAGLHGHWRRNIADCGAKESSTQILKAGFLALTAEACNELAGFGITDTSVFEFRRCSDTLSIERDGDSEAAPPTWKVSENCFCLSKPLIVDRNMIVLLLPLPPLTVFPTA